MAVSIVADDQCLQFFYIRLLDSPYISFFRSLSEAISIRRSLEARMFIIISIFKNNKDDLIEIVKLANNKDFFLYCLVFEKILPSDDHYEVFKKLSKSNNVKVINSYGSLKKELYKLPEILRSKKIIRKAKRPFYYLREAMIRKGYKPSAISSSLGTNIKTERNHARKIKNGIIFKGDKDL